MGLMLKKRKWIGFFLIAFGLILISIPLYYEWEQEKKLAALEEALSFVSEADETATGIQPIEELPFSEEELKSVVELEIPSIQLKQKVLPETTQDNLSIALTQIKPYQTPGEGNFTIAGHRGYRGDRYFRQLPNVVVGDKALLHAANQTFIYEITSSEVIDPTAVEILQDEEDISEITLITCTVDGKDRIALKGKLINGTN